MKKCLLMAVMICVLALTGCGKEAATACSAVPQPEKAYTITVGVPKDAGEVIPVDGQRIFRHEGGEYEIRTQVFSAASPEKAVRYLTGKPADKISLVQLEKFDLPEYRFFWHNADSGALCSADLVVDGETCYAVIVEIDAMVSGKYETLTAEVFSTFGLFFDEGV